MSKNWWQSLYEKQQEAARVRADALIGFEHSYHVGLIRMITLLAGRTVVRELGEEQHGHADLYDGYYLAVFDGGLALEVTYTGASSVHDSFGNHTDYPPRVEYTLHSTTPLS